MNLDFVNKQVKVSRSPHLAEKIVFIDGLPGCGKTLFSTLVSAFDRFEKLTYSYEIEHLCALNYLGLLHRDGATVMIRMLSDLILYDTMMSREVNCRPSDLSSIFHDSNTKKYLKRFFQPGDFAVPDRVTKERPILPLTVHNLLTVADPIFEALGDRLVYVEIVRHPLYMIIQQTLNFEKMITDVRDFSIFINYKGVELPWFTQGWEDLYIASNPCEKAIYFMEKVGGMMNASRELLSGVNKDQIVTIPFEQFVLSPMNYMNQMEAAFGSRITSQTLKVLKKQKVPRTKISDGIPLAVYKRCGWQPPKKGMTERQELQLRRNFAEQNVSQQALLVLDKLSKEYEQQYMSGIL
jgi:hypothetical protein